MRVREQVRSFARSPVRSAVSGSPGIPSLPRTGLLFYAKAPGMIDSKGLSVIDYLLVDMDLRSFFYIDSTTLRPTADAVDLALASPLLNKSSMVGSSEKGIALYVYSTKQSILSRAAEVLKATSFNPVTAIQPRLWLDATQPSYKAGGDRCAAMGDQITSWPDISGNELAPVASSTKPTYNPTGINGLPGIQFNGNSDFKLPGFFTSDFVSKLTVFVVAVATGGSVEPEKMLFGCASPNFWLGLRSATTGIDITNIGITPSMAPPLTAGKFTTDGIYGLSFGTQNSRFEHERAFGVSTNAYLSCSISTSSKSITGSIAFSGQDLYISGLSPSGYKWSGLIGEILIFDQEISPEYFRRIYDYLSAKWKFHTKPLILCSGDSLTSGTGSTSGANQQLSASGDNYPAYLLSTLSAVAEVRTDASPGRRLDQLATATPLYGDLMLCRSTNANHIQVVWCLTNTLTNTQSASGTYNQLVEYCSQRIKLGWKMVVVTCLPQSPLPYPAFETDRVALNNMILANYSSFSSGVVDIAGDARFSDPLDATYYHTDHIHLTSAGYLVVAGLVGSAVIGLL